MWLVFAISELGDYVNTLSESQKEMVTTIFVVVAFAIISGYLELRKGE